jgi:outer membrane protein assembly factor BamE (lipoprotein component of BamABCDE complex)
MNTRYVAALVFACLIAGCAAPKPAGPAKSSTSTIRRGRDFDASKVKDIQKGKTTTQEIVQWFGQPQAKKIVSTNQIGWLYAWSQSTVTVSRTTNTAKGKESGYKKRLELLIADDVVLNYTFDEGPFEADGNRDAK